MKTTVFNQSLVNQRKIEEATKKETVEALVNAVTVVGYYDEFESKALDISKISIDIHGTIFFGTKLRIGNRTMTLAKTISNLKIAIIKEATI